MPRHERLPGSYDVLLRKRHVEVVLLGLDQDAEELAPLLGARNRRVERYSCRLQVSGLLASSAVGLLVWSPHDLFNAGFQLSYGAVLALVLAPAGALHLSLVFPARRRIVEEARAVTGVPYVVSALLLPIGWVSLERDPLPPAVL